MKKNRLENLLNKIVQTRENEISCSECFDLVSGYVDLELAGDKVQEIMPDVSQHLYQCSACREEYETLRDLRRLEEEGKSPSTDELRHLIK